MRRRGRQWMLGCGTTNGCRIRCTGSTWTRFGAQLATETQTGAAPIGGVRVSDRRATTLAKGRSPPPPNPKAEARRVILARRRRFVAVALAAPAWPRAPATRTPWSACRQCPPKAARRPCPACPLPPTPSPTPARPKAATPAPREAQDAGAPDGGKQAASRRRDRRPARKAAAPSVPARGATSHGPQALPQDGAPAAREEGLIVTRPAPRPQADRPRVLLLWPGGLFGGGANFGVPQLLSIASVLERGGDAIVDIVDLDMERALRAGGSEARLAPGYDLIGISCYSSYDYLKVMAIADSLKRVAPDAWLTTGGYHASARPGDFTRARRRPSPFDFVVVGDGEAPMLRLVQGPRRRQAAADARARPRVDGTMRTHPATTGSGSIATAQWPARSPRRRRSTCRAAAPSTAPFAWSAPSATSPGGPSIPSAPSRRSTAWIASSIWRAGPLFVADALFGMKTQLAQDLPRGAGPKKPCRARKVWLLIRVDLVDREDLELMARANVSPGFGLESGDPEQLERIRKAGKLERLPRAHAAGRRAGRASSTCPSAPTSSSATPARRRQHAHERRATSRRSSSATARHDRVPVRGIPFGSTRARPSTRSSTPGRRHGHARAPLPMVGRRGPGLPRRVGRPLGRAGFRDTLSLSRELFDPIVRALPERFVYGGPPATTTCAAIANRSRRLSPSATCTRSACGTCGGTSAVSATAR